MIDLDFNEKDDEEFPVPERRINPAVIVGGFAGGLLIGGFLLWQNTGRAVAEVETQTVQAPVQAPTWQQAIRAIPELPPVEANLVHENERLKTELQQAKLEKELAEARRELAELKTGAGTSRRPPQSRASISAPIDRVQASTQSNSNDKAPTKGELTLEYWNKMNSIFTQEAAMRSVPTGGLTAANAADFLQRRASSGEFAAKSLRELEPTNVDREVVSLVAEITAWYQKGVRNNQNAGGLLEANQKTRQGSRGNQWKSAEKNHTQQINSINRKGERIRKKMSKKYGLSFPPMQ